MNERWVNTYPDGYQVSSKDEVVCGTCDSRAGEFMLDEVGRLLHEKKSKVPFGLYITNSVQEEVGLQGAEMITQTLKPDVAIVTDVCHDTTTPMINQKEQ